MLTSPRQYNQNLYAPQASQISPRGKSVDHRSVSDGEGRRMGDVIGVRCVAFVGWRAKRVYGRSNERRTEGKASGIQRLGAIVGEHAKNARRATAVGTNRLNLENTRCNVCD